MFTTVHAKDFFHVINNAWTIFVYKLCEIDIQLSLQIFIVQFGSCAVTTNVLADENACSYRIK